MKFDKDFLFKQSKSFCMFPWVHLHVTPTGASAPCCIADSVSQRSEANQANNATLMELVNSPKMNKLRKDMIDGVKNSECNKCYSHDDQNLKSARVTSIEEYGQYFSDVEKYTNEDGSISNFNMRYFDFRFSNICNFKCRTCGPEYSSQWEQEYSKHNPERSWEFSKFDKRNKIFSELLDQVDYMDAAYFAGGEPLITEEHYIMLEEMIKRNKTDIKLRYNTNLSNFKFKNKDIIDLWKQFKHPIDIYASIDHYGVRAEYIRHGTDWEVIENNFRRIKQLPFIKLKCNSVLSVFNLLTFDQFYGYLIDNQLYTNRDNIYMIYAMSTPEYLSVHVLPESYKSRGIESLKKTISKMEEHGFKETHIDQVRQLIHWVNSIDYWERGKDHFRAEIHRLDKIRNESFGETFPELGPLIKFGKKTHWLMQTNNF